ncbi:YIP1 family protein [Pseudooctadecabacter jejudonensis]|uniref:Yip1 domain protein n=1 Tax=Pseudooctadecabacter jejudonensis TaxID=1391910 RepID=A0A1Y5RL72_9RHOB|nr:YIP1 family protein [Pseudooctadecabacter jejudonensis]SLN17163.1 Yip1 domain protein [Pseudooctadecabacter jejudonensis]
MDFSATSVWTLTKLYIRDPAQAARIVMAAHLPMNVSILMIVLSGVMSGVMAAVTVALYGVQTFELNMPDGSVQVIEQASPLTTGAVSALLGVIIAYLIHWVGRRSGGQGELPQVLAVLAAFQIAMTVLSVLTSVINIAFPFIAFLVVIFVVVVTVRGLIFSVKEAHLLDGVGKSVMIILASIFVLFLGLMFALPVFALLFGGLV